MADQKCLEKANEPKGIGGWLILPTIGFFINAATWLFYLFIFGVSSFTEEFDFFVVSLSLVSILLFSSLVYTIMLEFKKKRQFPTWAILNLWLSLILVFINLVLSGDPSVIIGLIFQLIGIGIWTAYFSDSKRVRNTFIH